MNVFKCVDTRMWFLYRIILDKSSEMLDKEKECWTFIILFGKRIELAYAFKKKI
jgi:hypothetical protein